ARELEVEIDLYRRARAGAVRPNRFARAARRRHAVERPGNRLEDRGLSRAVRADDPRDARLELDVSVDVLAKVRELQAVQAHQTSSSIGGACATSCATSRYVIARSTNTARSTSASSGRAISFSRTISFSDGRRPGEPAACKRSVSGRRRSRWKFNARRL